MSTTTVSFHASAEFAEQTMALANVLRMSRADYVREAVREKNERVLKKHMTLISKHLSARHLAENQTMDATSGDGLSK